MLMRIFVADNTMPMQPNNRRRFENSTRPCKISSVGLLAQGITHIGDLIAIENAETRGLMRTQHAESKDLIQSEHAKTTHTILSGLQNLQIQSADDADGQRLLASLYFSQFDAR